MLFRKSAPLAGAVCLAAALSPAVAAAETKIAVVEAMARQHEFPLKCSLEEA